MTASTRFGTDTEGVATLLKSRQLKVPIHQRSYAWKLDQVTDYWNDLHEALSADQDEYFLGSVVLTQPAEDSRHTIIDGQQRLATTSILIACIRDALKDRGDAETADEIERDFLASKDRRSLTSTPHLILNAEDANFFKQAVINAASDVEIGRPSHENVSVAKSFFLERLEADAPSAASESRNRLLAWIDYLERNAIVIVVDVADESDAFLIFETLNYRGVPLTVADLLKNYLFGLAGAHLEAVQRSWASAVTTLESFGDPDLFVTFLRHYWISENGLVRERDLFRSLKAKLKNPDQVLAFSGKLEHAARNYVALLIPDHEAWADLGFDARSDVETLVRLRIEQNRPLLLSAMDKFEPAELKRLLKFIVSWSVRGLVVGGFGAGTTESAYANAAQKVREGAASDTHAVYSLLKEIIPSDSRFQARFTDYRPPTNKIARYYLLAFERRMAGDVEPEFVPNEDEEKVNLEHVFPRNAKPLDWPAFREVDTTEWSGRLGNLALLQKSKNSKIGNKPFSVKKPKLEESDLAFTKQIGEKEEWTPDSIAERQTQLAALAVDVWPLEP